MDVLRQDEGTKFPTTAEMKVRAFELLCDCPTDMLITYEQWTTVLGIDPSIDRRARSALLRAGRKLLVEQNKKLVNVRKEGYRIIKPTEHVGVSQNQQKQARRKWRDAMKTATHVIIEGLSETEVGRLMTEQARVATVYMFASRMGKVKELPSKQDLKLPSSKLLLEMIRRKK